MVLITMIGIAAPGKVFAFSKVSIFFTLPVIIFAPIVGVLVDRWDKRRIMTVAHIIQSGILAITPFFIVLVGGLSPVLVAAFLFFGLDLFNNTSKQACIPAIIPKAKLLSANSVFTFFARIASVVGMVLGGFIIRWMGWRLGFYFDALTHLTAGLLVLGMLPLPRMEETPVKQPSFSESIRDAFSLFYSKLKEVAILVVKDRLVLLVMSSIWALTFVSAIAYTVLIFLVQQVLGLGTAGVGVLGGVMAAGMILGALLLGISPFKPKRTAIILSSFTIIGLLLLIGPFLITTWFLYLVALLAGILFSFIAIAQDTLLQEEVMAGIRGRIFSTKEFMASTSFLISTVLVGLFADVISYKRVLFGCGILLLVFCGLGFLFIRGTEKPQAL